MAGKKPDTQSPSHPPPTSVAAAGILGLTNVFVALVEKLGFPGALLVVLLFILNTWSTTEQKHRMIEMYALGAGIVNAWPIIVMSCFFFVALWAQNGYLQRRIRMEHEELIRVSAEKTALQVNAAPMDLQHTRKKGE